MNPTNGKGSKQRPVSIPKKQFDDNWEKIFGNKGKSNEHN